MTPPPHTITPATSSFRQVFAVKGCDRNFSVPFFNMVMWAENHYARFLEIYEQYPLLWNLRNENYKKLYLRNDQLRLLMKECKETGFLPLDDMEDLKKKIRAVKQQYRRALHSCFVMRVTR